MDNKDQEYLPIPDFLRRKAPVNVQNIKLVVPRRNPFTRCRQHAKLSNSVTQCLYSNNPYKGVWLKAYFENKQIDYTGKK